MVATALPLILYPYVLIMNLMGLAAHNAPEATEPVLLLVFRSYLIASTLYPAVYLYTFTQTVPELTAGDGEAAMSWQLVNVYYLLGVVALLALLFGLG